jgi:hypothetical protein
VSNLVAACTACNQRKSNQDVSEFLKDDPARLARILAHLKAPQGAKRVQGFQTGDLVRAVVTRGTKAGAYVGQVAVRIRGSFNITTARGRVTDIHHRFCTLIARSDGYTYQQRREGALPLSA